MNRMRTTSQRRTLRTRRTTSGSTSTKSQWRVTVGMWSRAPWTWRTKTKLDAFSSGGPMFTGKPRSYWLMFIVLGMLIYFGVGRRTLKHGLGQRTLDVAIESLSYGGKCMKYVDQSAFQDDYGSASLSASNLRTRANHVVSQPFFRLRPMSDQVWFKLVQTWSNAGDVLPIWGQCWSIPDQTKFGVDFC